MANLNGQQLQCLRRHSKVVITSRHGHLKLCLPVLVTHFSLFNQLGQLADFTKLTCSLFGGYDWMLLDGWLCFPGKLLANQCYYKTNSTMWNQQYCMHTHSLSNDPIEWSDVGNRLTWAGGRNYFVFHSFLLFQRSWWLTASNRQSREGPLGSGLIPILLQDITWSNFTLPRNGACGSHFSTRQEVNSTLVLHSISFGRNCDSVQFFCFFRD